MTDFSEAKGKICFLFILKIIEEDFMKLLRTYIKENIGIRNKEPNQTQLKFTELQPMADRISSCVESKIP